MWNSLIFEKVVIPSFVALHFVVKAVKEVDVFKMGCFANDQNELLALRHFSIQPIPRKHITFITVF